MPTSRMCGSGLAWICSSILNRFVVLLLKYIPDMTMQLPRILHILFSTFYACQSVLFLYLATSFAKKRAVTKHLTSKFCFVQHFLIKIQLTRFMVKCAKVEEAARSYLECTLMLSQRQTDI